MSDGMGQWKDWFQSWFCPVDASLGVLKNSKKADFAMMRHSFVLEDFPCFRTLSAEKIFLGA